MSGWSEHWKKRLDEELSHLSPPQRAAILAWLEGPLAPGDPTYTPDQERVIQQGWHYRYRLLSQRYLMVNQTRAYKQLLGRLSSLVVLRQKIRTWIALSRDRQRAVADVVEEVLQEMLNSDRYLREQIQWIAQCTGDLRLREALLFTTVEEYCLRPIRNQPLIAYRFVNFLRRSQRGGMTQVPQEEMIQLLSEDISSEDNDNHLSLWDRQSLTFHDQQEAWQQQQWLREEVKQSFTTYLHEQLGEEAVQWLHLYLQGYSPETIASRLNLSIQKVYRLREKITYHAVRIFALKNHPELVGQWLENSLTEHNLGLTPQQWQAYWSELSPEQQQLLTLLQKGTPTEAIAQTLRWKTNQVMGEWSKLYLKAQSFRNQCTASP